jgi:hypothetical protein
LLSRKSGSAPWASSDHAASIDPSEICRAIASLRALASKPDGSGNQRADPEKTPRSQNQARFVLGQKSHHRRVAAADAGLQHL